MDVRLITLAEGYEPYVYPDTKYTKKYPDGHPTIGYGHQLR